MSNESMRNVVETGERWLFFNFVIQMYTEWCLKVYRMFRRLLNNDHVKFMPMEFLVCWCYHWLATEIPQNFVQSERGFDILWTLSDRVCLFKLIFIGQKINKSLRSGEIIFYDLPIWYLFFVCFSYFESRMGFIYALVEPYIHKYVDMPFFGDVNFFQSTRQPSLISPHERTSYDRGNEEVNICEWIQMRFIANALRPRAMFRRGITFALSDWYFG